MSTKLLTAPCSAVPRSLGHHWDLHTGAASIKLVQAGQASMCYTSCLLSNGLRWTDTHLDGAPPATSCSLMIQTEKGTQECWTERSGNGGVRCLRLLSYHQSWQCLSTFTLWDAWMCFRKSEIDSIIHITLCLYVPLKVVFWCFMITYNMGLQLLVFVSIQARG